MNKKQWYTFSILFFLGFLFFIYDANLQAVSAALEFTANGGTLFYQAQTIRSAIYGSVGTILLILSISFGISGNFQKEEGKKK